MRSSIRSATSLASLLAVVPTVLAGFDPSASDNVVIYWGQNSYGQGTGPLAQQRLAYYCAIAEVDVIPLAFMNGITPPIVNFASASDNCTAFPDQPDVLDCPQIEEDIITCQEEFGKTIILSLGGATYTQGGWSTAAEAESAAELVWDMFGPVNPSSTVNRPFGAAVVDGVDFDFEATTGNVAALALRFRTLFDEATSAGAKYFYLVSAPQCVYPDAANQPALDAAFFDFLVIQFYNNFCGVVNFVEGSETQNAYNFNVWDEWAQQTSVNPDVKVLVGIPANTGAGGGYTEGTKLEGAIDWSKKYTSFGGVMAWDFSQMVANEGFLGEVVGYLA